ncbi:MAG: DMT family transporter [Deltaproteobacteria bacterium]|nr:DMT family transporter [Deltaproteobacteria bacterium]
MGQSGSGLRLSALVTMALVAFAANSVLCRMALAGSSTIDPLTFTSVRVGGGALTLAVLVAFRGGLRPLGGSVAGAAALLVYAGPFSYAYVELATGTGALVLFAAVQLTMIGVGLRGGERPRPTEWLGFVLAFGGLVVLVFPGIEAPDPLGALLMAIAGVGWGVYSLLGRKSGGDPTRTTAGNFIRGAIVVVPAALISHGTGHASWDGSGLFLAAASGALASGLGYAIWYAALRDLSATRAGFVQLTVPILAAAAGIVILDEALTLRFAIASVVVLGGVALSIAPKRTVRDSG